LLEDILDPNKEVVYDYRSYLLVTNRGQMLTGLLGSESGTTVKLRRADGAEDVVLRSDIQELRASGKSLMPEGLEQLLTVQGLADVLAFLREPSPLPAPKPIK
jgi:putative heme-binding domain-containing protein